MKRFLLASLSILFTISSSQSFACSAFSDRAWGQTLLAKNYDWVLGHGLLVVNKRHVQKSALTTDAQKLSWTSRYGSITFNQFGREFPNGGINERGLGIEILWLSESQYPTLGSKPAVNEAQWIQYLLDTSSDLNQAIARAKNVRILPRFARAHYMACDRSGDCAVFEYIAGKLKIYSGDTLPKKILTNSTYSDSLRSLASRKGFGGKKEIPTNSYESNDRFALLASQLRNFSWDFTPEERENRAFQYLKSVENEFTTVWSIVYDLGERKISFHRRDLFPHVLRSVSLRSFDFSCKTPVKVFDLDQDRRGNITPGFTNYTTELNALAVRKSSTLVQGITPAEVEQVYTYPDTTRCLEK